MNKVWTQTEINKAIELYLSGLTTKEIAKHFSNVTKNQIVGIFYRNRTNPLWLEKNRIKPIKKQNVVPVQKIEKPKQLFTQNYNFRPKKYSLEFKSYEKVFTGVPVKFLNVGLNQCRWIVHTSKNADEITCCGQPTYEYGKAWCDEHRQIVYRKVIIDEPSNSNANSNKSSNFRIKK